MQIWLTCNGHLIQNAPLTVSLRRLRPRALPMSPWQAGAFSAVRSNLLEEPCLGQCPVSLEHPCTCSKPRQPRELLLRQYQSLQVRLLSRPSVPGSAFLGPEVPPGTRRPWLRLRTCPLVKFQQFLLAVFIVAAFAWDLSAVSHVTIRSVQTSVRVWTIRGHRRHACDACHKRGW